ncbi:hypothetical protein AHAS_Ahas18G0008400 [Arachis hypogaea]
MHKNLITFMRQVLWIVNYKDVITIQKRGHSGCTLRLRRSCAYIAEILHTSVVQMLLRVTS